MKTRLPKALLLAVLCSTIAYAADTTSPEGTRAFLVTTENIIKVDSGSAEITDEQKVTLTQGVIEGSTNETPYPIVKDGDGELVISEKTGDIKMANPLVVREGTMTVNGVNIDSTSKFSSFVNYIAVGGKDATLKLDNGAKVSHTIIGSSPDGKSWGNSSGSMSLGTADGAATVILDNKSTLHTDHYIFAGDHDGNGTGTAGEVGHTKYTWNVDGENAGKYASGTGNRTQIQILGGSTLSAGTSLQFSNVDVLISGEGSKLTDYERRNYSGSFGCNPSASNHTSYLAHDGSYGGQIETNISIQNGGAFVGNWNLVTGGKSSYPSDSVVNITVGNADAENAPTSTFTVKGHFAMGDNIDEAVANSKSSATLTVNKGGAAYLNIVTVGKEGQGNLIVNQGGRIFKVEESDRFYYQPETDAYSSAKLPIIAANENGTITINGGIVDIDMALDGGKLSMTEGAVAAGLTATTGTINLSGNVTFTGDVMLGGLARTADTLTINIEQGSTIYFYDDVNLSNAIINVLLTDAEVAEGEQLFTIASVEGSAYEALKDATLNLQYGNEVTTQQGLAGVKNVSLVPEPTTATLSLLALMGLAARRRRK